MSFFVLKTQAQNNPENQLGTWYMFDANHLLSENFKLLTNVHFRYFELATEFQQEIYRIGLNYTFRKNINITAGFVYSETDTSYKSTFPNLYEFRFYQDFNLKNMWNKMDINHRIRLAQRFKRQNFDSKINHTIRYGLFLEYPLSTNLKIYAFNELFVNFTDKIFDQNRIGSGIIRNINNDLKFRIGYFYTKFSNSELHRLQLGIILTTHHLKKSSL